ncbi:transmembrane protease serine 9-like [Thrips palmi]|uniref:Transmembrane protease serine 9-like n=1 Tax=Thrips palmi TaxID=161013 RepID=A0A6P8ZBZ8_THRPL|nr:transmembrane protease serine 9-like [Thrips palmi]
MVEVQLGPAAVAGIAGKSEALRQSVGSLPVRRALLGVTGGRATLGRHYRSKNRQEVAVAEAVVHPKYAADRRHHDIALLRLARPVALSALVRPACLHTPSHGPEWGLRASATGWEASGHWQAVDGELRRSQLTVLQPETCRKAVASLRESQLCTGRTCLNNTFPPH